jgi:hypothetical protein
LKTRKLLASYIAVAGEMDHRFDYNNIIIITIRLRVAALRALPPAEFPTDCVHVHSNIGQALCIPGAEDPALTL